MLSPALQPMQWSSKNVTSINSAYYDDTRLILGYNIFVSLVLFFFNLSLIL